MSRLLCCGLPLSFPQVLRALKVVSEMPPDREYPGLPNRPAQ
ncbi:Uncharacterized protein dnm_060170 [Desulfonema magnum]|uniref:Uncharacterized protein n=1 Tax=Desulfonema magnum TaxID=45655 RepID=A0A975BRA5_9BACT|nr:Uncharacterized protein dnm_060170 [Desulfonema magnum]